VNVCLLDLSETFDKMNHSALFIKMMDRLIPVQVFECFRKLVCNLFVMCQMGSITSRFYELKTGVRQGGVLSRYLL